jgi:HAD superfamily hydrolase (TIGR01509 family)
MVEKGDSSKMKAVIFDMDGVIINSEPLHFMVDKLILEKMGIDEKEDYLDKFVGFTNPEMWKQIKQEKAIDSSIEDLINFQVRTKIEFLNSNDFFPISGISDLLLLLQDNGFKMAVASSSPKEFIQAVLKKLNIENYFSVILSAEEVKNGKPKPDIFIKTIEMLNVDRKNCFIIEDSKSGVTAAKSANVKCVGFKNPDSGNQDLSNADFIVNEIHEINVALINKLLEV